MSGSKAKLIRKFATKFSLNPEAIKRSYRQANHIARAKLAQELTALLIQPPTTNEQSP
jgi:hypothetical protein